MEEMGGTAPRLYADGDNSAAVKPVKWERRFDGTMFLSWLKTEIWHTKGIYSRQKHASPEDTGSHIPGRTQMSGSHPGTLIQQVGGGAGGTNVHF